MDETAMVEGTLTDHGVKSLKAVHALIAGQELHLDYEAPSIAKQELEGKNTHTHTHTLAPMRNFPPQTV